MSKFSDYTCEQHDNGGVYLRRSYVFMCGYNSPWIMHNVNGNNYNKNVFMLQKIYILVYLNYKRRK